MACILLWSSAVRVHDSQAYRKTDVTRERMTCILELREMLLSFQTDFNLANAAAFCAVLESISGLEPSSYTTEPRYLKPVTVSSFCPFTLVSPFWQEMIKQHAFLSNEKTVILHKVIEKAVWSHAEGMAILMKKELREMYSKVSVIQCWLPVFKNGIKTRKMLCQQDSPSYQCGNLIGFADNVHNVYRK